MSTIACIPPPTAATDMERASARRAPKQTLLIVDDEEGPRQSIRIVFKDDYDILIAEGGAEAIALARENPIDAAVLDIRMAGMSGIDVLNALKSIDPATEVVMLTAYETLETARQALRLGACDYLNKPFDIATIRDAVRSAMERRSISLKVRQNTHRLHDLQEEIQNQRLREELARTRGEIYASIIHDINGPLTVISGFVEVITQRIKNVTHLEGDNLESIKERLTRVSRQVASCIQISNRYLSFLRGCSNQSATVSVNQILKDLGELLRAHPDAKNNTLVIRSLQEDLTSRINSTDLIQILLNLAINAFQSSSAAQQVEIRAERLAEPLDLSPMQDGPSDFVVNRDGFVNSAPLLVVAIRDTGTGVRPEIIGKVFDPYFTTKSEGNGTGLGLCIVKRLVEQAGGLIHLHSTPGCGAVFNVYLPVQPAGA